MSEEILVKKSCSGCGESFACGAAGESCWCAELPPVNIASAQDCFCPKCLVKIHCEQKQGTKIGLQPATVLIDGEDYYMEGQALVFTASYHLRRGHCCESGCRHCPYS